MTEALPAHVRRICDASLSMLTALLPIPDLTVDESVLAVGCVLSHILKTHYPTSIERLQQVDTFCKMLREDTAVKL